MLCIVLVEQISGLGGLIILVYFSIEMLLLKDFNELVSVG